jgi:hypothetical protein
MLGARGGMRTDRYALELEAAVVRHSRARLYSGLDEPVAARGAIGFTLAALVGNRGVALRLVAEHRGKQ